MICPFLGVEVCANHPYEDPKHGQGQYTEKRIHLSRYLLVHNHLEIVFVYLQNSTWYFTLFSRLPQWIRSLIPKIFYVTEKAWNYYPHTTTEYTVL